MNYRTYTFASGMTIEFKLDRGVYYCTHGGWAISIMSEDQLTISNDYNTKTAVAFEDHKESRL